MSGSPLPGLITVPTTLAPYELLIVAAGYVVLLGTSGVVVSRALATASEYSVPSDRQRDVGAIVGKAENVLVLTFMLLGAYTALAVVFAGKSIVRREDMKNDSLFYLAGTLVNFTYSVIVGLLVQVLIELL